MSEAPVPISCPAAKDGVNSRIVEENAGFARQNI
jgi:hypothetical protein